MKAKNSEPNTAQRFHEGRATARAMVSSLEALGSAFRRTGNAEVAEELWDCAHAIEQALKTMDEAYSDLLTGSVNYSRDMAVGLVTATMAGVKMGRESNSDTQTEV